MDWGVGDAGWGGDALAGYPRLPKSFTNAKTAKKRKHKELFVTEEALLKPVRLGKPVSAGAAAVAGGKASTGGEKPQASRAAANGGDGDGTGGGPKPKKNKNKFKQQQQQQQPQREQEQAQQEQRQQRKKAQDGAQRLVQEQRAEAAKQSVGQPEADEAPRKKKSKNKFKQQLDGTGPLEQQGLLPAQQQQPARGSNEEPQQKHGKKQRSKQERRQQPPDEAVAQPPSSKKQQEHADNGKQRPKQPAGEQQPAGVKPQQGATPEQRQPQQSQQQQQQQQQQPQQSHRGSKLLDKMRARLQGGHFRQLNEALYTRPGADAFSLMAAQPELFGAYHDGFQQQVRGWPLQPVDVAVKWAKAALPRDAVVADFGCGDAKLAASVEQTVHSLDLVATAPGVIACNMAATPLPAASCDAAVFSLSLMGTDYGSFLSEAHRVLKAGGWLWIAEVRSRFAPEGGREDFGPFIEALRGLGFKLVKQDASNRMFVTMLLRKKGEGGGGGGIRWPQLRACVYKKR